MAYRCIVDFHVGIASANSTCFSIATSGISLTNSPRQYHWSPAGYTASNAVFHAGIGTGAIPSSSGLPNERASRSAGESSSPA